MYGGCRLEIGDDFASRMVMGKVKKVKTFVEAHSCTRSNKGSNKLATQGWIAKIVVRDKLKSNGVVSTHN
ncbi:hypothetical protein M8C21_033352 [Ambrosia artemisiifolia]|uniref:Uncharacterized protein n=1 Tax=Ambrosia artemisiifolia TaxID=4212 RepID=A0AAD5DE07_AMBAR|nr:hypothetical protein M8C21_033352 [Ambrosia artemisiifolia]